MRDKKLQIQRNKKQISFIPTLRAGLASPKLRKGAAGSTYHN